MRDIKRAVFHCSATHPDWMAGEGLEAQRAEIRQWHVARGWRREGYHGLLGRGGGYLDCRPFDETGAHVKGNNTGSLGFCLIGGHGSSALDQFGEHFTEAQGDRLRSLIIDLRNRFGPILLSGHNFWAAKACPGFCLPEFLGPEWGPFDRTLALGARTMIPGDRGDDVAELQRKLNLAGYAAPLLARDGIYGGLTRAAVVAFQRSAGLDDDGIAGPKTLAALEAATAA